MKYRVCVVKYGYAIIEADNEEEAIEIAEDAEDRFFDWSDFGEAEIVEEFEDDEDE